MKFIQVLLFIIFYPVLLPFYLFSYLKEKETVNENNIIENNSNKDITDKSNLKIKGEKQEKKALQKRNKLSSKSNPFSSISSNRNSYSNIIENNFLLNEMNLKNEIKLDLKEKLKNQINKKINIIEDNKYDELLIKGNIGELEILKYLIENVSNSLFIFNSYIEKENESTEIDLIMTEEKVAKKNFLILYGKIKNI